LQELRGITNDDISKEEILVRVEKIRGRAGQDVEKNLAELLIRCLNHPEEYNINIFQKECELLKEKYSKIKDNHGDIKQIISAKTAP
jgi:hypothetical protein